MLNKLIDKLTEKSTTNLLEWYFSSIDSPEKRLELVDSFLDSVPRKFNSTEEKQEVREILLKTPLQYWGTS